MQTPHFISALATGGDATQDEAHVAAQLLSGLGGVAPDLVVLFASPHYGVALDGLGRRMRSATGAGTLIGTTGGGIVGGGREVEQGPALSALGALLPGAEARAHRVAARQTAAGGWDFTGWPDAADAARSGLVLLADPFSFPMQDYLPRLATERPGLAVAGGLASGGRAPGQHVLWVDDEVHREGAAGVVVAGEVELSAAVSQGCRPVGEAYVVTGVRGNLLLSLGGKPAARVLLETLEGLADGERELFRRGAFVGLALDATRSSFRASDLLVRNVLGLHPQDDAVAVAASELRRGGTVQFMVRDAASASREFGEVLAGRDWRGGAAPGELGALLFTCGGRGRGMFEVEDHDAGRVQAALGPDLPLAGFFANGEIGPVGGKPFLHGFTASLAVLRKREPAASGARVSDRRH
jgi:small ligand-binding sensory domain FIST